MGSMSSGVPVITMLVGLAKDIAISHKNALVVPKGDPEAFCEKTLSLIGSDDLTDRLAINGRKMVLKDFHWSHLSKSIYFLYEKALDNRTLKMKAMVPKYGKNLMVRQFQNISKKIKSEDDLSFINYIRKAEDWVQADKIQLRLWMKYPRSLFPINPIVSHYFAVRYNNLIRRICFMRPI